MAYPRPFSEGDGGRFLTVFKHTGIRSAAAPIHAEGSAKKMADAPKICVKKQPADTRAINSMMPERNGATAFPRLCKVFRKT